MVVLVVWGVGWDEDIEERVSEGLNGGTVYEQLMKVSG